MIFKRGDSEDGEDSAEVGREAEDKSGAPPLKPFSRRGAQGVAGAASEGGGRTDVPRQISDIGMRGNRSRPVQGDSSKLIVGRDIRLKGEISACSRIVVEGYVEASLVDARTLEVTPTGHFKGNAEVEEADISGHFEGELIARYKLIVRNQGKISGSVRYGRIIVESGGVVAGDMQALPATDRPGQKREGGLSGSRIGTDKTS